MFKELTQKFKMARMTVDAYANMIEAKTFGGNEVAEAPVKALVMLLVLAVLAGALIPTAINSLHAGSNTSGNWTASESATYAVIGIIVIIAVVLIVVRIATE